MSEYLSGPDIVGDALTTDGLNSLQQRFASGPELSMDDNAVLGAYPEFFTRPETTNDPDFEGDTTHPSEGTK